METRAYEDGYLHWLIKKYDFNELTAAEVTGNGTYSLVEGNGHNAVYKMRLDPRRWGRVQDGTIIKFERCIDGCLSSVHAYFPRT